jgi:hypothetical protein
VLYPVTAIQIVRHGTRSYCPPRATRGFRVAGRRTSIAERARSRVLSDDELRAQPEDELVDIKSTNARSRLG